MNEKTNFWDALAPHHAAIEDNYLDRASLRQTMSEVRSPVLVVGPGHIPAEATALPMGDAVYETVIYATGVVDFNGGEEAIREMENPRAFIQNLPNSTGRMILCPKPVAGRKYWHSLTHAFWENASVR